MSLHAVTAAEDPRLRNIASRKICVSLMLQQLLYYQIFFSISWIAFYTVWLFYNYWQGLKYKDDDVVRTVMMLFWLLAEPARLSAGWYGNLQENVPWLVLFVILTIAPTHATIYYMYIAGFDNRPYNKAIQMAQIILVEAEVVFGIYAVRRMYKMQKEQFYLFEFAMGQRRKALEAAAAPPTKRSS